MFLINFHFGGLLDVDVSASGYPELDNTVVAVKLETKLTLIHICDGTLRFCCVNSVVYSLSFLLKCFASS
jgi:hypothetical protein